MLAATVGTMPNVHNVQPKTAATLALKTRFAFTPQTRTCCYH